MTLTSSRIKILAQLSLDIGNIFFASVFLGPLLVKPNYVAMVLGLLLSFTAWYLGIKITRN